MQEPQLVPDQLRPIMTSMLSALRSEKPHVSSSMWKAVGDQEADMRPIYQSSISDWIEILSNDSYQEDELDGYDITEIV
jgi:hypothetical protein